jgi:hypothetical protein
LCFQGSRRQELLSRLVVYAGVELALALRWVLNRIIDASVALLTVRILALSSTCVQSALYHRIEKVVRCLCCIEEALLTSLVALTCVQALQQFATLLRPVWSVIEASLKFVRASTTWLLHLREACIALLTIRLRLADGACLHDAIVDGVIKCDALLACLLYASLYACIIPLLAVVQACQKIIASLRTILRALVVKTFASTAWTKHLIPALVTLWRIGVLTLSAAVLVSAVYQVLEVHLGIVGGFGPAVANTLRPLIHIWCIGVVLRTTYDTTNKVVACAIGVALEAHEILGDAVLLEALSELFVCWLAKTPMLLQALHKRIAPLCPDRGKH